tara:strand:- start:492 stop:971 length:480 start_codon:yes stop_codon:yes gene_type:complete
MTYKHLFYCTAVFLLAGCSTLMPIAGGGVGGAIGAALGGPPGAAIGGAAGVTGAQMAFPNDSAPVSDAVALAAAQAGNPAPGTTASTIHEAKNLIFELGWWYLLLFVLAPLFSKRGRTWVKKFTDIHNTVSQKDIDSRDAEQDVKIEEMFAQIENLKKN